MKKKNKYQDFEEGVVFCFGVIILFIFFWALTVHIFQDKPEFKITKEECWNESVNNEKECFYGDLRVEYFHDNEIHLGNRNMEEKTILVWYSYEHYLGEVEGNRNITFGIQQIMNVKDEIADYLYKNNKYFKEEVESLKLDGVVDVSDGENVYLDTADFYCYILKQDLSIEWLEENCECVDCDCSMLDNEEIKETCLNNQEDCPSWDCIEYKCEENYYVKIK